MRIAACIVFVLATCIAQERQPATRVTDQPRTFDCESSFRQVDDAAALANRFGAAAVSSANISLGEGFYEAGSVLFADSAENRVEIRWADRETKQGIESVHIRGTRSNWRTPAGVSLGVDLRTLEKLNRKPFRLLGFGWDYAGTQVSWRGGHLETSPSSPCSVRVRLRPGDSGDDGASYRPLVGSREFSSGHPAMQHVNPRVYEVWLAFTRADTKRE